MKKVILLMMLATGVVQADQMTATKSGCMGCHHLQNKLIGPSIKDIAAKHKGGMSRRWWPLSKLENPVIS